MGDSSEESDSSNEGRAPKNESDPEDPDEENPGDTLLPTIAVGIEGPKINHTFEIDASGVVTRLPLQREFASGVRIPETWEDELEVRGGPHPGVRPKQQHRTLFDSEPAAAAAAAKAKAKAKARPAAGWASAPRACC